MSAAPIAPAAPAAQPAAAPKPAPAAKPNPNARLALYRKLHTWFGLFAAVFLVVIAITGIYLNHKDTFRSAAEFLGAPAREEHEHRGPAGRPGATAAELAAAPVGLPRALELAGAHLGDRAVERVELRPEHGRLVYKVKAVGGPEVLIDATSGSAELKGGEDKPKPDNAKGGKPKGEKGDKGEKDQKPVAAVAAPTDKPPPPARGMDWGKAIKDLHTGKIGGDAGKLLVDLVAVLVIVLTLTGVYLWGVPALRKRRSARQRAAADAAKAAANT